MCPQLSNVGRINSFYFQQASIKYHKCKGFTMSLDRFNGNDKVLPVVSPNSEVRLGLLALLRRAPSRHRQNRLPF